MKISKLVRSIMLAVAASILLILANIYLFLIAAILFFVFVNYKNFRKPPVKDIPILNQRVE